MMRKKQMPRINISPYLYMRMAIYLIAILFAISTGLCDAPPRLGLVLSGGGAKGLAHVGVLEVLEDEGIGFDIIGGTSMGAIVGGLYAIGYDADSLRSLTLKTDWEQMLMDEVPRQYAPWTAREEDGRYFLTFEMDNWRIDLPEGMISGQNITNLLTNLTMPAYHISDFGQFSTPFVTNATDLETGEEIVLRGGHISEAIRASMAIPSVFTPVELDGHLLTDGGFSNNFPASEVQAMGADYMIGVYVGFTSYDRSELRSLTKISEQVAYFNSAPESKRQRELVDVLIMPDMEGLSAANFNKVDVLIERGRQAAREALPEIRKLLEEASIPTKDGDSRETQPDYPEYIEITRIKYEGLKNIPDETVRETMDISLPARLSVAELEAALRRVYSTRLFQTVTYRLEPVPEGVRLVVKLREMSGDLFRIGAHYDNDRRAAILLNLTYRNKLRRGSRLSLDFALGENPLLAADFQVDRQPHTGYGLSLSGSSLQVFSWQDGSRMSATRFTAARTRPYAQWILGNCAKLSIGPEIEFASTRYNVSFSNLPEGEEMHLNLAAKLEADSRDRLPYPTKGIYANATIRLLSGGLLSPNFTEPGLFGLGYIAHSMPLGEGFTHTGEIRIGTAQGTEIPDHYLFFPGGKGEKYIEGLVPFPGMRMGEGVDSTKNRNDTRNFAAIGTGLRYNITGNHFIISRFMAGAYSNDFLSLATSGNVLYGGELGYGYASVIGPVELTFSTSNMSKGLRTHLGIGWGF